MVDVLLEVAEVVGVPEFVSELDESPGLESEIDVAIEIEVKVAQSPIGVLAGGGVPTE